MILGNISPEESVDDQDCRHRDDGDSQTHVGRRPQVNIRLYETDSRNARILKHMTTWTY